MSNEQGLHIVAVRKNGEGNIEQVKFNNGEVADLETAIRMAEADQIANVNTGATRGDHPHKTLRSNPDGDPTNNLDHLPTF
ncbi:DUF3892 domain-containing protein [Cytobacillus sp. FJAT-54145]|uniref:DUF3892 domain-containing protein n=1 Tax=Cytobacillus spartinae TaxID=3299023 RepID=A0ABW6KFF1_9BACI